MIRVRPDISWMFESSAFHAALAPDWVSSRNSHRGLVDPEVVAAPVDTCIFTAVPPSEVVKYGGSSSTAACAWVGEINAPVSRA